MSIQELPYIPFDWKRALIDRHLEPQSIYDFISSSASKIDFDQFLLLQVLWTKGKSQDDLIEPKPNFLLKRKHYESAKTELSVAKHWVSYLNSFRTHRPDQLTNGAFPELGTFSLVRQLQVECGQLREVEATNSSSKFTPVASRTRHSIRSRAEPPASPTPGPKEPTTDSKVIGAGSKDSDPETPMRKLTLESPESARFGSQSSEGFSFVSPAPVDAGLSAVEDEQIVNTALVIFLRALTMHFKVQAHWSLKRQRFVFGEKGDKVFEARVDGCLRSSRNQVKAIIEVKPFLRETDPSAIRMQESAQMAAWICNYPDEKPQKNQSFR